LGVPVGVLPLRSPHRLYDYPVPSTSSLISFLLVALVVIVVPGPSVVFVIGRAMILGTKGAVLSVLGNAIGVGVQIVAVSLGVGALVYASPAAFFVIKVIGAGFLIYLGVQGIRHRKEFSADVTKGTPTSTKRLLLDSSAVGITNAKTLVFFIATFPLFVDPGGAPVFLQMLFLGALFFVIGIASDIVWAVAAGGARHWFARSTSRLAGIRLAGGVALIGLGAYLGYYSLMG
jgi:threonine/homoserine/homoserine lactone efflux protein